MALFLSLICVQGMATKQPNAPGIDGDTALKENPHQTKPPPMWQLFGHTYERATQIMLKVHTEGRGICGIFPRDVAAMKVEQVGDYAKKYEHPLHCGMEEI